MVPTALISPTPAFNSTTVLSRLTVLVALTAFLLDWATKSLAVALLGDRLISLGVLSLGVVHNDAFAFSSGSGMLEPQIVALVRLTTVVFFLFVLLRSRNLSQRTAIGFALLIAGGCGNTADVLFRGGAVVDFIGTGPLTFPVAGEPLDVHFVFNIADLWIFAGAYLLWPLVRQFARTAQYRVRAFERRLLTRMVG